jgi:ATP-dependent RNA helicase HelY
MTLWSDLHEIERRHGLSATGRPDLGFVWAAYRWAQGVSLRQVLEREELTAGDFVRWMRQVVDLLGQISQSADGPLRDTAKEAVRLLQRGVVASVV